jgi:hypothetical protein
MAIVFPISPSVNDTFTAGSITYKWDGDKWIGLGVTPADKLVEGSNKLEIDGSNNLVWTGNNVGIGTDNPITKLHLSSGGGTQLTISNTSTSMSDGATIGTIDFSAGSSNTVNARVAGAVEGTSEAGGDLVFETRADGGSLEERLRITSGGNAQIANGNLVIGTSGKGIDFSANANAAGMTSELLDDYEEGTWTPVMVQGVTSPTYSNQAGRYTRIGNKVYVDFYLNFASGAANGSHIQIGGLPFTLSGLSYGNAGAGQLTRGGGGTSYQNLNNGDGNITFYGAVPLNYFSCYIGGTAWGTVVANITNLYIIGTFHYNAD